MRNILALIGLFVVGFAAIGWYCNWYTLKVDRTPEGTLQIKTEVHTDKVADDSSAFFEKVGQIVGEKGDKGGKKSQPAATPGNTPGPATGKDALKLQPQSGNFEDGFGQPGPRFFGPAHFERLTQTRVIGTGK
jgi:hypothetical protein